MQQTLGVDIEALPSKPPVSEAGAVLSTLVILGASTTALAVARDAHRHGLRPVVVDSQDGPAFHSRWTTAVNLEPVASGAWLEQISELSGAHAALIATSDVWIRFLIDHRRRLSASYALIVQPDDSTLEICLDKKVFADWCVASGLPAPAAWCPGPEPRPALLEFPVLLRPLRTMHSVQQSALPKAVQINDEAELEHWLQKFAAQRAIPLVTQSLLGRPLEQYSVPFARRAEKTLLFTARKVRPSAELCQTGTCVQMCVDVRAERLARLAVERLDYFGIGEVEILRDTVTGKDYLIEINARPWLQYALAPASNHDFLGLVLERPGTNNQRAVKVGRTWVDLYPDLFSAFSRSVGVVRHGRLGLLAYLRSLARCNVFALFDWRDPLPFLRSLRHR